MTRAALHTSTALGLVLSPAETMPVQEGVWYVHQLVNPQTGDEDRLFSRHRNPPRQAIPQGFLARPIRDVSAMMVLPRRSACASP